MRHGNNGGRDDWEAEHAEWIFVPCGPSRSESRKRAWPDYVAALLTLLLVWGLLAWMILESVR